LVAIDSEWWQSAFPAVRPAVRHAVRPAVRHGLRLSCAAPSRATLVFLTE